MLTENIALSGGDVFITGVAYHDRDGDDFYSIGEGHSGATIGVTTATIDGTAQAAAAGGYQIGLVLQDTAAVTVDVAGLTVVALHMDVFDGNGNWTL